MRNDRPTPKDQILSPIHEGHVEIEGFGTARPMGHTGELRRTKEENRELKAQLAQSEKFLEDARAAFKEHTDRLEAQISAASLLTQQALKREKHYREALEIIADPSTACMSWSETVHCLRAHARNAINQKP